MQDTVTGGPPNGRQLPPGNFFRSDETDNSHEIDVHVNCTAKIFSLISRNSLLIIA